LVNVLVVGSGGREHAIGWKLSQSDNVDRVFHAPGNGGTLNNVQISADNLGELAKFASENDCFTVVGPEVPLAIGIVDFFNEVDMFNKAGAALGLEIIKKFSPDYNQNKYHKKQEEICTKFGLEPSKCVNFGLGDNRYSKFNRGAKWNRVCLSNLLIE